MTTPYTTGSITLTNGSAVVTGAGTAWQTALIAGGTIYVEAGGNPLPILAVDSNTQITAAIKWKGASGTYPYAIMRDTAYGQQTVANAQALSTYLQRLDNEALSALASLDPAPDQLPYFNGAATAALASLTDFARTLLEKANAADFYGGLGAIPNAQIPGTITGNRTLTGLLSLVLGASNQAMDYAFFRPSDFGPGKPLLSIKKSATANRWEMGLWDTVGSAGTIDILAGTLMHNSEQVWRNGVMGFSGTANGYLKFPNGLLLQWGYNTSTGGDVSVTYPIAFAADPIYLAATVEAGADGNLFSVALAGRSLTSATFRKRGSNGTALITPTQAIRWFAVGF